MNKNSDIKKRISYYTLCAGIASLMALSSICGCDNNDTYINEENETNFDAEDLYILIDKNNNSILCYKDVAYENLDLIQTDIYSRVMGFYYPIFTSTYGYYSINDKELIVLEGEEEKYGYNCYQIDDKDYIDNSRTLHK